MTKVLFVTAHDFRHSSGGAGQRTHAIYQAFQKYAEVQPLLLDREASGIERSDDGVLHGPRHFSFSATKQFGTRVQRISQLSLQFRHDRAQSQAVREAVGQVDPDLIVYRYMALYLTASHGLDIPTAIDIDDLNSEKYLQMAKAARGPLIKFFTRARANTLLSREREAVSQADALMYSNTFFEKQSPKSFYFPNIPYRFIDVKNPRTSSVGFIGNLDYRPNMQGVSWFLAEVWPLILAGRPDARFVIAGRGSERYKGPRVESLGMVRDPEDLYSKVSATVVPVLYGGGSNIKLVESVAAARPCVATGRAVAAFGADLEKLESVLGSTTAAEMASRVLTVLGEVDRYADIAIDDSQSVRAMFSPERLQQEAESVIDFALGTHR